jgi:catechol 2,3-dioxygenase-like lactoylglutathione lyase family enzyme
MSASPDTTDAPSIRSATPVVTTDDVEASLAFYRDGLGLDVMMTVPDAAPYDWVMLGQNGSPLVQLQTRAETVNSHWTLVIGHWALDTGEGLRSRGKS